MGKRSVMGLLLRAFGFTPEEVSLLLWLAVVLLAAFGFPSSRAISSAVMPRACSLAGVEALPTLVLLT